MGYVPPLGNAVNFNFTGTYTAPNGARVIFNFGSIPTPPPGNTSLPHAISLVLREEEEWAWQPRRRFAPVVTVAPAVIPSYRQPQLPAWMFEDEPFQYRRPPQYAVPAATTYTARTMLFIVT